MTVQHYSIDTSTLASSSLASDTSTISHDHEQGVGRSLYGIIRYAGARLEHGVEILRGRKPEVDQPTQPIDYLQSWRPPSPTVTFASNRAIKSFHVIESSPISHSQPLTTTSPPRIQDSDKPIRKLMSGPSATTQESTRNLAHQFQQVQMWRPPSHNLASTEAVDPQLPALRIDRRS
ncbi:hypothetical protein DL96DRAFT_1625540 [Flagelloscypha sp. PMI_526]|nr:hypothetical protein DL96DRAFT_1625540 [Flagelloscypha sp. PMI_526]